jgi:hypothetical protein
MSKYQAGDYVKVEFKEDSTGESEWMWMRIDRVDDSERIVFGQLDNEPVVNKGLKRMILQRPMWIRTKTLCSDIGEKIGGFSPHESEAFRVPAVYLGSAFL